MKKFLLILSAALALAACKKDEDPVFTISTEELKFDANGGAQKVFISTNRDWTAQVPQTDTWYTLSALSGTSDTEVTVTVEPYEEATPRTSTLTFDTALGLQSFKITQNGPVPPEQPESSTLKVRGKGGRVAFPAVQGYVYEVGETPEWISVAETRKDSVVLQLDTNRTDAYRTADVVLKTTAGAELEKVSLEQSWRNIEPGEVLIEEVFFTSNALPTTGQPDKFHGDQYFKITNNSDELLYLDGLMISEAKYASSTKTPYEFKDPIKKEACGVGTVYVIPGGGHDVPVEPGKSLIIANNAQNHLATNPNSFDLSGADFEWYDKSTSSSNQDVDNPDVPNLDIWFTYSLSIWVLHDRGFKGYIISMPPYGVTKESYLAGYKWEGEYINHSLAGDFEMNIKDAYRIPNTWVLDGVNTAIEENFQYTSWDESIDAGWTHCGKIDKDPERYGKSVLRKRGNDGKLIDTNNSTNDFTPDSTPSLKK